MHTGKSLLHWFLSCTHNTQFFGQRDPIIIKNKQTNNHERSISFIDKVELRRGKGDGVLFHLGSTIYTRFTYAHETHRKKKQNENKNYIHTEGMNRRYDSKNVWSICHFWLNQFFIFIFQLAFALTHIHILGPTIINDQISFIDQLCNFEIISIFGRR